MPANTIPVFEVVDIVPAPGAFPIQTRTSPSQVMKAVEYSVDQVQLHMTAFIESVQQILAKGAQLTGEFHMESVEVQAEIGLEGKVGFLGLGASARGSSQIKIVFARRKP